MRCERFLTGLVVFAIVAAACAREEPAPPPTATTATVAQPAPPPPAVLPPKLANAGSYDEAMIWFKSAASFHFVIDEGGVHGEGAMTRPTIGAEKIEVRVGNDAYRAAAGPKGVTWTRRIGPGWKEVPAPEWGNRLYQRVTLVFDPAKSEGAAQLVGTEGDANHYRFTDKNTGNVHDVLVNTKDNHVERITIANVMELKIQP